MSSVLLIWSPRRSFYSRKTLPKKYAMLKKPITLGTRSDPLRATAEDIAMTHGAINEKAAIRAVPTHDCLFWGRARHRTVAKKPLIRRTAALRERNNALPWANQIFGKWLSFLYWVFSSWLSQRSLRQWKRLTSDKEILSTVLGMSIDIDSPRVSVIFPDLSDQILTHT